MCPMCGNPAHLLKKHSVRFAAPFGVRGGDGDSNSPLPQDVCQLALKQLTPVFMVSVERP
jgi:hypothetical protein